MIFSLSKNDFVFLQEHSEKETSEMMRITEENSEKVFFSVGDISEFQGLINDAIVLFGMNNQDTVNEIGKRLYKIYDEIYFQKHNMI